VALGAILKPIHQHSSPTSCGYPPRPQLSRIVHPPGRPTQPSRQPHEPLRLKASLKDTLWPSFSVSTMTPSQSNSSASGSGAAEGPAAASTPARGAGPLREAENGRQEARAAEGLRRACDYAMSRPLLWTAASLLPSSACSSSSAQRTHAHANVGCICRAPLLSQT
jgi:hypothetical protein